MSIHAFPISNHRRLLLQSYVPLNQVQRIGVSSATPLPLRRSEDLDISKSTVECRHNDPVPYAVPPDNPVFYRKAQLPDSQKTVPIQTHPHRPSELSSHLKSDNCYKTFHPAQDKHSQIIRFYGQMLLTKQYLLSLF